MVWNPPGQPSPPPDQPWPPPGWYQSPPTPPPERPLPPPGWYRQFPGAESYWDGVQWTQHRAFANKRISHPIAGWVMVGAAVLMLIGSVSPWATLGGLVSASGTAGDGVITLVLSLGLVGLGLTIGLKRGRLWAPILGLVLGLAALAVAVYDINNVSSHPFLSVGFGLTLTAVAAAITCLDALVGIFVRTDMSGRTNV